MRSQYSVGFPNNILLIEMLLKDQIVKIWAMYMEHGLILLLTSLSWALPFVPYDCPIYKTVQHCNVQNQDDESDVVLNYCPCCIYKRFCPRKL